MERYVTRVRDMLYLWRPDKDVIASQPYLPDSILWRQKEQFSDGVGYSWIDGSVIDLKASPPLSPIVLISSFQDKRPRSIHRLR